jgi:Uma2 family endonuclease
MTTMTTAFAPPKPWTDRERYPDSDGQPIADNTLQFQYIVTIKEGLEALFADNPDVFVAGDLLWYPVEQPEERVARVRAAPDVMVAFGRPKGYRGSYKQWEEGDIAPRVVFEILSPGNTGSEMARKFDFYERYGVEEYYLYDPDRKDLIVWTRQGNHLRPPDYDGDWISPLLGVRFHLDPEEGLQIFRPDGERFKTLTEVMAERNRARAELNDTQAERDAERERAERLAARLRELGVDPDALSG